MSWTAMLEAIARVAVGFGPLQDKNPVIIIETRWWPQGRIKIEAAVMVGGVRTTIVGYGNTVEEAVVDWVNAADRHAPGWSGQ